MLELLFQGFIEWIYGLILECWWYFAVSYTQLDVYKRQLDEAVKVIYDRDSTLAVIDTIKVRITERAKQHKETEVIFYDVSGLREAQKQLNAIVADLSLIHI